MTKETRDLRGKPKCRKNNGTIHIGTKTPLINNNLVGTTGPPPAPAPAPAPSRLLASYAYIPVCRALRPQFELCNGRMSSTPSHDSLASINASPMCEQTLALPVDMQTTPHMNLQSRRWGVSFKVFCKHNRW